MKNHRLLFVIATACLVASLARPALAQKKPADLKYPPLNKFEIPEVKKHTLDCGIKLYLVEDHTLPLVNFSADLGCGSYLEPPTKVGLAEITGTVMRTGGTESMSGDDIDAKLEAIGATVETSVGLTEGSAYANGLSEYAETIVQTLADVLRRPVFDEDKIELAKTEERAGIARRNDEPMGINAREFRKLIYGNESPYARHTEYATIEAITRDDLVEFHRRYVQPQGMQLAVWGDFKTDDMIALLSKYFGDWPRGTEEIPPPPEVDYDFASTVNYAEKTDVNQSNIFIGHIGGMMGDPDYPATIVMNTILGGAFGSRLFGQVRTTEGLAYAVSGTYTFGFSQPGVFYMFVSTKSGSTVQAIESCIREARRMQTDPPTDEELQRAKDGYLNSFVFNFDTKSEILGRMMTYERYGLPADYLQQIKEGVEKVTAQDVVEVAKRKLNPDKLQIMVTGNASEFDRPLSDLGEVTVIDITIPGPTQAEFAATDEEIQQGWEWLSKAVKACGGMEAFKKVRSMQQEASLTVNMPQGSMALEVTTLEVLPDMTRQVVKTPMGQQVVVYNGQEGWMQMAGQTQMLPADDAMDMKKGAERSLVWLFQTADKPDYQVAYKGTEDLDGREVARLEFLTASGSQFALFVDPETSRPAGMRYMGKSPMGPAETLETFQDFAKTGDVMLPSKAHRDLGAMSYDVEVTSTQLNVDYNEVDFQKPEGL